MRGKRLVYNTVIMTATSILLRTAGLFFQIFISKKMGAAGVGLYYLVLSAYMFAATIAISGARFATTRLISEELGKGKSGTVRSAVKLCLLYSLFFGVIAAICMFCAAPFIGLKLIKDIRTVFSLRLLAVSLPFLSAGAVLSGYFTGVARVSRSAIGALSEQIFKIAISAMLLYLSPSGNTEIMCASVVIGSVLGEIISFLVILIMYLFDIRKYPPCKIDNALIKRMLSIALPLGVSAYARTALTMAQNLMIPRGFKRSGKSTESALSDYGTIQGMVFPIITFPAVLFASISELMVPELTEEQINGRQGRIRSASNKILRACMIFSVCIMGIFIFFSDTLGMLVYSNADVGKYIRLLAFLMPIMYLDSVTDGMLRGLGEHMYSMKINIIDSLFTTVLVYVLLPKYALIGYIAILYISEIFNYICSMRRLKSVANIHFKRSTIYISLFASISSGVISNSVFKLIFNNINVFSLLSGIILFAIIYIIILILLGEFKINRHLNLKNCRNYM